MKFRPNKVFPPASAPIRASRQRQNSSLILTAPNLPRMPESARRWPLPIAAPTRRSWTTRCSDNPFNDSWRVMLKMKPSTGNKDPVDIRCTLQKGEEVVERNMDLSLESAMSAPDTTAMTAGPASPAAVGRMECRLRQGGKLFSRAAHPQQAAAGPTGRSRVWNAPCGARRATATPRTELAAEEMDPLVTEWFAQVLQNRPSSADHMLSTRGRLALLLADMPGKWQDQFLRPGPWPTGIRHSHARNLSARRPGLSDLPNDAAPAGPRPDHDADQIGPDMPTESWASSG